MSGLRVADFRLRVRQAFGDRMQHATPATVREFVDDLRREDWQQNLNRRRRETGEISPALVLPGGKQPSSYEGVLREFFTDTLESADDQALIELWIFAIEMAYAGIEEVDADRVGKLFGKADGNSD